MHRIFLIAVVKVLKNIKIKMHSLVITSGEGLKGENSHNLPQNQNAEKKKKKIFTTQFNSNRVIVEIEVDLESKGVLEKYSHYQIAQELKLRVRSERKTVTL